MKRWVGCCRVETGLFSVAFAPDYERTRRFYVYFTNKPGQHRDRRVQGVEEPPAQGRPGLAPQAARDQADGAGEPQRRHRRLRPRRLPLRRDRRRRALRRPERERAEEGLAARQAPADRPAQGQAPPVPDPALEPLCRQAGAERDLRARPAQPVSLLVRRQPDPDRRRRPEPPRGGRHRDRPQGEGRELRLERLRGLAALPPGQHRQAHQARAPVLALGLELLDHGRRRRPRRTPAESRSAAATSTPTTARAPSAASSRSSAARAATARSASASTARSSASAPTRATASTSSSSPGRSRGSTRADRGLEGGGPSTLMGDCRMRAELRSSWRWVRSGERLLSGWP